MKYKEYSDLELLSYINESEDANEIIYDKYKPLIKKEACKLLYSYNINGIELDDLMQQGMLGINKAILNYKDVEASFYTYVKICVVSEMLSLIKNNNRSKNKMLNESISYDDIEIKDSLDILNDIINDENLNVLINKIKNILSNNEYKIFEYKIQNYTNKEIAKKLNLDIKTVSNAIARIRKKVRCLLTKI